MAAAYRRALMLSGYSSRTVTGLVSGLGACSNVARGSSPYSLPALRGPDFYHRRSSHARHASKTFVKYSDKGVCFVDTLALVCKMKAQGIPVKQAEAIASIITKALIESSENVTKSHQSQGELQKEHFQHEVTKLKSDVKCAIESLHNELSSLMHKEIYDLIALREAAKYDMMKYGCIVSVTVVGLSVFHKYLL